MERAAESQSKMPPFVNTSATAPGSNTSSVTTAHAQLNRSQSQANGKTYLQKRRLHRHVNRIQLWGFCVGVVICGSATGWQAGLPFGWINLMVATILAIVVYAIALWSAVEMSTALPFSSAHTAFAQAAFGSRIGAINGFIVMISFAQQAATNVDLFSHYVARLCGWPTFAVYLLWIICYFIMIFINLNSRRFFNVVLAATVYCALGLCAYIAWAVTRISSVGDWSWISPVRDNLLGLESGYNAPLSFMKVVDCFCFAIWWFVGIEAFPVTMEEIKDVKGDTMPAVNWSMGTLVFYSLTLIWIVPVLPPFSPGVASTDHPIGVSILQGLLALDPAKDQAAFENANLYATSRYMYGLSRGGLLPTSLSLTAEPLEKAARETLKNWFARSASSLSSLRCETSTATPAKPQEGLPIAVPVVSTRSRAGSLAVASTHSEKPRAFAGSVPTLDLTLTSRKMSIHDHMHPSPNASPLSNIGSNAVELVSESMVSSVSITSSSVSAPSTTNEASKCNRRSSVDRTPVRAVLTSAMLAYLFNWILEVIGLLAQKSNGSPVGGGDGARAFSDTTELLLRISTWFANLSHAIQLASYLKLHYGMPTLNRPCPSPAGTAGAVFALVIVIVVGIVAPFGLANHTPYLWSIILLVGSCSIFLVYFRRIAKPRLVANAPERLFIRSILEQQFFASAGNNGQHETRFGGMDNANMSPHCCPDGKRANANVFPPLGTPTKILSVIDQSFSRSEQSTSASSTVCKGSDVTTASNEEHCR